MARALGLGVRAMMLGLALLYVGAVLFLNGLWLLGKIQDREIIVINVVTGFITLCVALDAAFGRNADASSIRTAALTLLFSTTYLWVAYNRTADVQTLTQRFMDQLETWIRRYPDQWYMFRDMWPGLRG